MNKTAAHLFGDCAERASRIGNTIPSPIVRRVVQRFPNAILCISLLAIGGCIPVPRGGGGSDAQDMRLMSGDELRAYVEEVFRHQNGVTTRLMMASPDSPTISDDDRRRIEQAEIQMNDACASLNDIASARASGEDVDRKLENTVRKEVRTCAREAERLDELLDELGVEKKSPQ